MIQASKTRNPKHEIRNKSEIQNDKFKTGTDLHFPLFAVDLVSCFVFFRFEFVSDFEFRVSGFESRKRNDNTSRTWRGL